MQNTSIGGLKVWKNSQVMFTPLPIRKRILRGGLCTSQPMILQQRSQHSIFKKNRCKVGKYRRPNYVMDAPSDSSQAVRLYALDSSRHKNQMHYFGLQ